MRSQLFRQRSFSGATRYRGDAIAKIVCELNAKVAEPPDPLNGDKIAWQRTAMTESIERRNSGAHERRGLGGIERFGHASQRFNRRDHEFLIAPVITNSANLPIRTVGEITPPARGARAVLAAMPADSDSFAFLPVLHTRADTVDNAGHLVSGHARIRHSRKEAFLRNYIAVANSTRLNTNPHMTWTGLRDFTVHKLEIRSRLGYLHHFHFCHLPSLLFSKSISLRRRISRKFPTFLGDRPVFLGPDHQNAHLRAGRRNISVGRSLRIGSLIELQTKKR